MFKPKCRWLWGWILSDSGRRTGADAQIILRDFVPRIQSELLARRVVRDQKTFGKCCGTWPIGDIEAVGVAGAVGPDCRKQAMFVRIASWR